MQWTAEERTVSLVMLEQISEAGSYTDMVFRNHTVLLRYCTTFSDNGK